MTSTVKNYLYISLCLSMVSFILILSLYRVYVFGDASVYDENGLLENAQVFILFLSCCVFLFLLVTQHRDDKLFLVFFAFLCFSFILRELDIETLNVPNVIIVIGSGTYRNIMVVTGFLSMIGYGLIHFKYYLNRLNALRPQWKVFILLITAGILLYVGDFFEGADLQYNQYFEEISELFGYVLILLFALYFPKPSSTK